MNSSGILFGNRLLDIALVSCFAAQFYKVFSPMIKGEKIQWARLIQTGGMPSSHASTVVSLATGVWLLKGTVSIEFAIAMVFSSIVLYDATGIRRTQFLLPQKEVQIELVKNYDGKFLVLTPIFLGKADRGKLELTSLWDISQHIFLQKTLSLNRIPIQNR